MKRALLFGLIQCLFGICIGYYFRALDNTLPLLCGVSAFIGSSIMWYLIVERKNQHNTDNGTLAGASGAIFSHYLSSYLGHLHANFEYWFQGKQIGSLPGPPIDPLLGIFCMIFNTLLNLLVIGWFSVPTSAFIGFLFIKFTKLKDMP